MYRQSTKQKNVKGYINQINIEMKYLAEFESWKSSFAETINEQDGATGKGFIVVFGSTDNDNLKAGAAEPLGIKQDEIITGTIKGMESMLKIGASKSFAGANHTGKKGKPGEDFLNIKVGDKKYSVREKGFIKVPFDSTTVLEIEGEGNGLLALMRALYYLNVSVTKNKFDWKSPFEGTLFIKLGDTARKGMSLSINGKYDAPNGVRISTGYVDAFKSFESVEILEQDKAQSDSANEEIIIVADTISDAIRAAQIKMQGSRAYTSQFSAYRGFSEMDKYANDNKIKFSNSTKAWEERYFRYADLLAVSIQYCFKGLSDFYPMDMSKIYKVDISSQTKKILDGFGGNSANMDVPATKKALEEIFDIFKPTSIEDYPEFTEEIAKYWKTLTNAIINRVIKNFPGTYSKAMSNEIVGQSVQATGGIGKGKQEYKSGQID